MAAASAARSAATGSTTATAAATRASAAPNKFQREIIVVAGVLPRSAGLSAPSIVSSLSCLPMSTSPSRLPSESSLGKIKVDHPPKTSKAVPSIASTIGHRRRFTTRPAGTTTRSGSGFLTAGIDTGNPRRG